METLRRAVDRSTAEDGHVWLNVGSGAYPEPGFINLDNHPMLALAGLYPLLGRVLPQTRAAMLERFYDCTRRAPYVRYDCRKPLTSIPARADHILCSHFIEHVFPEEGSAVLRGFWTALKPGGTLHLIVPDLAYFVDRYREGGAEAADTFQRDLLLSRPHRPSWRYRTLELLGFDGMQHRWMYDRKTLERLVDATGFCLSAGIDFPSQAVRREDPESLHVFAVKPITPGGAT